MTGYKEKWGKVIVTIIVSLAFLVISGLIWKNSAFFMFTWIWSKIDGSGNDYFSGTMTLIAAIFAVYGISKTIENNNETKRKELLDNLDSKSEWRKQLYDVASKTFLTTDDVYRVLASLRYFPHEIINEDKAERYFHKATQTIYSDLYSLIVEHRRDIELNKKNDKEIKAPLLTFKQSENVRIYTKFLLKHHWEYNKDKKAFIPKKEKEVWYETKNLIALDEDKYFKEVTKFKKQTKFIMCDYIFKSIFKLCKQLKK